MTVATSPLVTAYLADLDRALAGAEPADRLEIVDAVREHIDAALAELGADPSQAQVAGVLRRLGSADTVAAAWTANERPASQVAPAPPHGAPVHGALPASSGLPYGGPPPVAGAFPGPVATPPGAAAPSRTSPWLVALVVLVGIAVVGPGLLALLGALFLLPIRMTGASVAAPPGWLVVLAGLLLIGVVVACGIAWRRSARHRRAWGVGFLVGLVLLVLSAGSLAWAVGGTGGGVEQGDPTVVERGIPVPAPAPGKAESLPADG